MGGELSGDDESSLEAVAVGVVTTLTLTVRFGLMFAEVTPSESPFRSVSAGYSR